MKQDMFVGVGGFQANEKMKRYVMDVLDSGRLSYGPYVSKFEKEFAKLHASQFAIMSNSGTSALQVALQALKIHYQWHDGDEVIVPATTFVASANVVLHNNLKPVFVDVEEQYFGLDPEQIEAAITPKTKCILVVHLFGMPAQMDKIMDIAQKYNLRVVEDSCETMFATFKNKPVGSFGDIGCFSTYIAHILITGVGGLSITSNPELAIIMRSLVNHGRDSIYISIDDDKNKSSEHMKEVIEKRFSFVHTGHSFRVTELEGALGLAQLEDWEENVAKRQKNAAFLTKHLSKYADRILTPQMRPDATHVYMMYPLVLKNEPKTTLVNHLETLGVETRDMLPLINQPIYQGQYIKDQKDFPISEKILTNGFYIGTHPYLSTVELEHTVEAFAKFFEPKANQLKQETSFALILIGGSDFAKAQEIDFSVFNEIYLFDIGKQNQDLKHYLQQNVSLLKYQCINKLSEIQDAITQELSSKYILFFDLRGAHNPIEIAGLMSRIQLGHDMVIASRFIQGAKRHDDASFIKVRGFGNRMTTLFLNLSYNASHTDSFQSFRCITREAFLNMHLSSNHLFFYEMSVEAAKQELSMHELPAIEGQSRDRIGLLRSVWNGILTIPLLLKK